MRQATNLHDASLPWLLPGIIMSTGPNDYQPIKQFREFRFNGKSWDFLEDIN